MRFRVEYIARWEREFDVELTLGGDSETTQEAIDKAIDEDYESMLIEESDLSNLSPEIEDSYEIDENGDRADE